MSEQAASAPSEGGADTFFDKVIRTLNGIGTLWILALLLLINADVLGRNLFNHPISGVIEMIELSMVAIVFLQLGDATRVGRLTRSDGFFGLILLKRPRIGYVMGAIFDFLGALFMFLILYGSWPLFRNAWVRDYYVGNEGLLTIPVWPVKLILLIGTVITLALFVAFVIRYVRAFRDAGRRP